MPRVGGGLNSGLRSVGLSRICQGEWWMTRWWWPHKRARLSRLVLPPLAQWVRWWAWHIRGGRRQAGKVQCRSRRTRAVQMVVVTGRRRRPTSRTSPWLPRTAGMISASQASRRRMSGGRSVPSAVVPTPAASEARAVLRVAWSRVTRSRAGVPWVSGGRSVSRACWAVATRASHRRVPWSRGSRCVAPRSPGRSGSGWSGQVSGSSAARRRAPSSADPRPRPGRRRRGPGLIER